MIKNRTTLSLRCAGTRFLAIILLATFLFGQAHAQPVPMPLDPEIRYGQLDNGLIYYIRHNTHPEQRADFYIAQKVGSMQEEDNQRGLAHFLEHMAFNGTTHFPDKALIEYLESIGAQFGSNINAYTSFDETVYTLMNIPVVREGIVDSCLLILADWSDGILLCDEEIDKERGVIQEEWRTRDNATMRIWDQLLPQMLPGSKYAHRMPIGIMEVVMNFPYQDLRNYYHKWYRTDLQGIVIVGDVDVDYVEGRIKEYFSPKTLDPDRAERKEYGVPDNSEPIVAYGSDRETTASRVTVYFKHDPLPEEYRGTDFELISGIKKQAVSEMLEERLREYLYAPDPPFLGGRFYDGQILGMTKTKEAFTGVVICGDEKIREAFTTLLTEIRRADLHGFTEGELGRFKDEFMSAIGSQYRERNNHKNDSYAREYVRHFIDGEATPGIEAEYRFYETAVPAITLAEIDELVSALVIPDNVIITVQTPEDEDLDLPDREEILALFHDVMASDPGPYEDPNDISSEEGVSSELVGHTPEKGKIVKEETDERFGTVTWDLANGAKVVIMETDLKNDQILFHATRFGGWSQIPEEYDPEIKFMNYAATVGGLGNFNAIQLPRVLAGKNVSVSSSVGEISESVAGHCSPEDLDALMQLVYLHFTGIRTDTAAYRAWEQRIAVQLRTMAADSSHQWTDSLQGIFYNYHPMMMQPTVEELDKADYGTMIRLYKERFGGASDFLFFFVGNIDPEKLRPLAETYIASLPAGSPGIRTLDMVPIRQGEYNSYFTRQVESPKVSVFLAATGTLEPSPKNSILMNMVRQTLFSRYTETLREEEGGTYGARVNASIHPFNGRTELTVRFDTNEEQYENLSETALREIRRLAHEEITDAEFNKIREYTLKKHAEDLKENSYWLNAVMRYDLYGLDYLNGYEENVRSIRKEEISALLDELLSQDNLISVTMNGIK